MSLRVLLLHTRYRQRGGEDHVVDAEAEMLRQRGHEVDLYEEHNDSIAKRSAPRVALETVWSRPAARAFERKVKTFRPDLVHAHNLFPLMSPSIYWKAAALGVPLIQTLHNFRLICPQAMLLRDNAVCEACVNRLPLPAVRYRCYHDSAARTAVVSTMIAAHRLLGTYRSRVSAYIVLTEFSRRKFIEGGLPAELLHVKPNFVDVPALPDAAGARRGGLFVGRMSPEKGLRQLAEAVNALGDLKMDLIGTGPLQDELTGHPSLRVHGWQAPEQVHAAMRSAAYLVVPSIWYETFGLIVIEAFANGLPVIANRIGALEELVTDGVTGLLCEPGSVSDLQQKIAWAEAHPQQLRRMGEQARQVYETYFTPDSNYTRLMEIYRSVTGPMR